MALANLTISMMAEVATMVSDMQKASQESARAAKEMQGQWKESLDTIEENFKRVAEFVGIGLSIDWMKEIGAQALESAEKVSQLSQVLGVSQQSLQTMSFAAGMVGGNLDTVSTALAHMERSAQDAAAGNQQAVAAFNAMGISSAQLKSLLNDPDKLLQTVAQHMAELGDGTGKTAITMQVFGRNAQQVIPFLNELGENYSELAKKSEEFGVTLSAKDQAALVAAKDGLNETALAGKGLANQFAVAMVPAVNAADVSLTQLATNPATRDFFQGLGALVDGAIDYLNDFSSRVKKIAVDLAYDWDTSIAEIKHATSTLSGGGYIDDIKAGWNSFTSTISAATNASTTFGYGYSAALKNANNSTSAFEEEMKRLKASHDDTIASIDKENAAYHTGVAAVNAFSASIGDYVTALGKGNKSEATHADALQSIARIADDLIKKGGDYNTIVNAEVDAVGKVDSAFDRATASQVNFGRATSQVKDYSTSAIQGLIDLQNTVDTFAGKTTDEYAKSWSQYETEIAKVIADYAKAVTGAQDVTAANALLDQGLQQANDHLKLRDELIANMNYLQSQTGDQVQALLEKYKEENDALGVNQATRERVAAELAAENAMRTAIIATVKQGHVYSQQEIDDLLAQAKAFADNQAALKQMAEVTKQWQSIAQNAFDSVFSTINKDIIEGGSVMKDLVNVAKQVVEQILLEFEKLAIINPLLNQIFGLSGSSALPTSSLGTIFNNIGGMFGLGGGAAAGDLGGAGVLSGAGAFAGSAAEGSGGYLGYLGDLGDYGAAAGGTASTAGSSFGVGGVLGALGGAYAGFNEFNNAGGGLGGVAGAAAYGYGTYVAGTALAAGLSGGLSAGLAAVPVVGWVALGAMVLDKLTGGDVFGTAYKPTGVTGQNLSVGAGGVNIQDWMQEHKHGALFSSGHYKNVDVAAPQDQLDAYNQAMNQVNGIISAAATALSVTAGNAISASWSEQTDKTGKVTSQTSTVLGQKFTEDAQHFFERVAADSEEAMLPVSDALTKFFAQFQGNADTLKGAADMLVAAQVDINRGMGLLGSVDTDLGDIGNTVQALQKSGESLVQTYARLQTEQMDVKADLEGLGMTVNLAGADFVKFADTLTEAAGGIDKLNAELSQLYAMYVPANNQVNQSLGNLKTASDNALTAIGESATESMATFWQDFQAAMPNLTADQLQKWVNAGLALGAYTDAVNKNADAVEAYAQYQVQLYGDTFVSAISNAVQWEKQQIDTANQLAQAAGQAGASQQVLAEIMARGSAMVGKAVADLSTGIWSDINDLAYNAPIAGADAFNTWALNIGRQTVGPNADSQKQAAQQSEAYDLLEKLGDYAYATGKSVADAFKSFGLSPDQIAGTLGITADQVDATVKGFEDQAEALTDIQASNKEAVGLLQDMVDLMQGKPLSYDYSQLSPTTSTSGNTISGGKVGDDHNIVIGPKPGATSKVMVDTGSDQVVAATKDGNSTLNMIATTLSKQSALLDRLVSAVERGNNFGPRNQRAAA